MPYLQQNQVIEAPYGTWRSLITAEMTTRVEKSGRNCDIIVQDQSLYWTEPRPAEKGRTVIVCRTPDGQLYTLTPAGFDVRSKVHEYGGRAFTLHQNKIYFINAKDQRLYAQDSTTPLTPEGTRFAELISTPQGIVAIGEIGHNSRVENFLALIDPENGSYTILDQGHDFYAAPTLSPDGKKIAWLTWNHPNMPWDATQLWVAAFSQNYLQDKKCILGGPQESLFQPQWSPKGDLYVISDRTGWWNLYRMTDKGAETIYPLQAEFGVPLWRLGSSTWCFTGRGEEILCSFQLQGVGKLALVNPTTNEVKEIPTSYTDFAQVTRGIGEEVFLLMGSPQARRRLFKLNLKSFHADPIDNVESETLDKGYFSLAEPVTFPSAKGRTSYGYYYAPKNKDYRGMKGTLPPLIVTSHGGPTASADPVFNLKVQYWTSRGFAILDVNYGGSTGYGRAYRDLLKGQWGIVDVEDCAQGALYFAKQGKVDPKKLFIRGGSAGGYTTLAALAFTKTFAGGASYFGVADLELLAKDTHKFEASYLDDLIGPYPACKELYDARSPLFHADRISCPVIFFQGRLDKVVPPSQAEKMYEALKTKGIKTKLVIYDNEDHGFREAENIKDSMEQELQFYLEQDNQKTR